MNHAQRQIATTWRRPLAALVAALALSLAAHAADTGPHPPSAHDHGHPEVVTATPVCHIASHVPALPVRAAPARSPNTVHPPPTDTPVPVRLVTAPPTPPPRG
ncbi:hypothetical protein [Arhodomonas aquaeolei]|uniref:hypothetical protein n=1 Tax=Arhodomonas aquaeolei TaxID=2369 RepID=UPI0012EC28E7|nr:hypothetical protein [Arhodomonas aquaeolei]